METLTLVIAIVGAVLGSTGLVAFFRLWMERRALAAQGELAEYDLAAKIQEISKTSFDEYERRLKIANNKIGDLERKASEQIASGVLWFQERQTLQGQMKVVQLEMSRDRENHRRELEEVTEANRKLRTRVQFLENKLERVMEEHKEVKTENGRLKKKVQNYKDMFGSEPGLEVG